MTGQPEDDTELEAFFQAARTMREEPDDDLYARVLAAAEDVQASQSQSSSIWVRFVERASRAGRDHTPLRVLGGWPVAAGLAATTCAGIWIGTWPQNPIAGTALFAVADTESVLEDWTEMAAFGLTETSLFGDMR